MTGILEGFLAKPVLLGEDGAAKFRNQGDGGMGARRDPLKLLHPSGMPFITEELWAVTAKRDGLLVLTAWSRKSIELTADQLALMSATGPNDPLIPPILLAPAADDFSDPAAEAEIGWVVDLVTAIRSVRAEMNITPATLTPLVRSGAVGGDQGRRRNAGTRW